MCYLSAHVYMFCQFCFFAELWVIHLEYGGAKFQAQIYWLIHFTGVLRSFPTNTLLAWQIHEILGGNDVVIHIKNLFKVHVF